MNSETLVGLELQKTEIVALINVFHRLSESVHWAGEMLLEHKASHKPVSEPVQPIEGLAPKETQVEPREVNIAEYMEEETVVPVAVEAPNESTAKDMAEEHLSDAHSELASEGDGTEERKSTDLNPVPFLFLFAGILVYLVDRFCVKQMDDD